MFFNLPRIIHWSKVFSLFACGWRFAKFSHFSVNRVSTSVKIDINWVIHNIKWLTLLNLLEGKRQRKILRKLSLSKYILVFDVVSFYPSISEKILKKYFSWARTLIKIPEADERLAFMARISLCMLTIHICTYTFQALNNSLGTFP